MQDNGLPLWADGGKSGKGVGAAVEIPHNDLIDMQSKKDTTAGGIRMYQDKLSNGEDVPPINVRGPTKDGKYYVMDGHHRKEAHLRSFRPVPAVVDGPDPGSRAKATELFRFYRDG